MSTISVRGLNPQSLAALKARATQEDASVNQLVLRLIDQGLGLSATRSTLTRHDDLDALAGTWRKTDAAAFEQATAAFQAVDAALWK